MKAYLVLHQPCSDLAHPHPDRFITSGPRVSNVSHIASANGPPGSPAGLCLISIHVHPFGQARLCSGAAVGMRMASGVCQAGSGTRPARAMEQPRCLARGV